MRIAIFILITMAILIYILYINIKALKSNKETIDLLNNIKILERAKEEKGKNFLAGPSKVEKQKVSSSPEKKSRFELMDI